MAVAHQLKEKKNSYLKTHNTDVAYIQETHFENENEALKLKRDWVGKIFHNSVSSKSRGVVILIHKRLNFVLLQQLKDEDGRLLCIQALINGVKVLCAISMPQTKMSLILYIRLIRCWEA